MNQVAGSPGQRVAGRVQRPTPATQRPSLPVTPIMKRALIALLVLVAAFPLFAQTYPRNFADGPAKWLMTSQEQKAWKNVKTDDEAIDFIDLFWARRDPTPETPRNENRLEFESRVAYADANFKEGNTRGALTERGRVLIVLGFPKSLGSEGSHSTQQFGNVETMGQKNSLGDAAGDPTGGRALAAKDTWEYTHEVASLYGVPRIEVVFLFDRLNGGAHRDPQRTDFTMALPGAINYYIKSPQLTTVPEWASSRTRRDVSSGEQSHIETTVTYEKKKSGQVMVLDAPQVVAKPAGAGRLLLLNDSMALQPQAGTDPFAAFTSVAQFQKGRELGWAAEYCSGQILENAPTLKVQLKVTAANGDSFTTDPEEYVPDSIKSSPGCYLLRGALPLSDVDPGAYKLSLTITGAAAAQSYNLAGDFRVNP